MFLLDNISAKDIGVMAEDETFLSRAPINYEEIEIEGKHGSDFIEKNYSNLVGSLKLFLVDATKLDFAKEMFTGLRTLTHNERITTIRFYDVNEISRLGNIKVLSVKYTRAPFWHKADDEYVLCESTVTNEGNTVSYPSIKLVGVANQLVDLTIGKIRFTYKFDNHNEVFIDCAEQTETCEGLSKSKQINIGYEYPTLMPGENWITVHSGTVQVYFMKKDAWL